MQTTIDGTSGDGLEALVMENGMHRRKTVVGEYKFNKRDFNFINDLKRKSRNMGLTKFMVHGEMIQLTKRSLFILK